MKNVLLALLLTCCATPKDKIIEDLPSHVSACACLLQPGQKIESSQVNWKDKEVLKSQVKHCRCILEVDFDDVNDPLDYIKPGTTFHAPQKMYPWSETFEAAPRKVD